jgi:nanoRNase/pAp phosphatase (c-di-AMP/oligoRNAs hydrolase)
LTLLEIEQHRINKYIWNKKQEVKFDKLTLPERSYNVAYVFAEQNVSLLGNAIAEEYGEEIDFVAIFDIGNNKVSLRGKHDNIDLGKDIARKYFSGGGHAKAGGFEINEILQIAIVRDVLLEGKYKKEDR